MEQFKIKFLDQSKTNFDKITDSMENVHSEDWKAMDLKLRKFQAKECELLMCEPGYGMSNSLEKFFEQFTSRDKEIALLLLIKESTETKAEFIQKKMIEDNPMIAILKSMANGLKQPKHTQN